MVSLITGRKGSGKTKRLIEQVNKAVEASSGNVVCVEKEHPARRPRPPLSLCSEFLKFYPPGRLPQRGGSRYNREKCGAP